MKIKGRQQNREVGALAHGVFVLCVIAQFLAPAFAQGPLPKVDPIPQDNPQVRFMQGLKFEQRLGEQVPLDTLFRNEAGDTVPLSTYVGRKPVVLVMPWFGCTMLCTQMLNGVLFSLKEMKFDVGREFDVVAISIDPREKHELAADKKEQYLQRYGRANAASGWHFLTGDEESIKRVADSIGYAYRYDKETDQYAHASGIVVLTPDGKISKYFYGVEYPARDLRLGLVEASENKIGTPIDRLLLFCYHYDPTTGKYGIVILNVIRLMGIITVMAICTFIALMLLRERRGRLQPGEPGLTRG